MAVVSPPAPGILLYRYGIVIQEIMLLSTAHTPLKFAPSPGRPDELTSLPVRAITSCVCVMLPQETQPWYTQDMPIASMHLPGRPMVVTSLRQAITYML